MIGNSIPVGEPVKFVSCTYEEYLQSKEAESEESADDANIEQHKGQS